MSRIWQLMTVSFLRCLSWLLCAFWSSPGPGNLVLEAGWVWWVKDTAVKHTLGAEEPSQLVKQRRVVGSRLCCSISRTPAASLPAPERPDRFSPAPGRAG